MNNANNLKALDELFPLSHKVTVYVPATTNANIPVDNTETVNDVASVLCNMFGGATASPAIGFWRSDTLGLIRENTTIVFAYAKEITPENISTLISLCENIRDNMGQEAIAIEIDNSMYFI